MARVRFSPKQLEIYGEETTPSFPRGVFLCWPFCRATYQREQQLVLRCNTSLHTTYQFRESVADSQDLLRFRHMFALQLVDLTQMELHRIQLFS